MAVKITDEFQARSIFEFFIVFGIQCGSNMQGNGQKHKLKLISAVIQKLNISVVTLTVNVIQMQNKVDNRRERIEPRSEWSTVYAGPIRVGDE